MSLPDVSRIRGCISRISRVDIRHALMAEYLFAGRIREVCGKVSKGDTNPHLIYGPVGKDVEIKQYTRQIPETFKALQLMYPSINKRVKEMFKPMNVAVFTVKIAKRRLEEKEEPHTRLIALPLDPAYEPWTLPLVNYYEQAGSDRVFPFTRQDVWHWITSKEPVFKGLTYPIEKYVWKPKDSVDNVTLKVLPHNKPFKLHALRHLRITELRRDFGFDGLQLAAYAGWSMKHATAQTITNERYSPQTTTYFPLYKEWQAYFPKLLIKHG